MPQMFDLQQGKSPDVETEWSDKNRTRVTCKSYTPSAREELSWDGQGVKCVGIRHEQEAYSKGQN